MLTKAGMGARSAMPLLQLKGLFKHFGPVQALVGVDLEAPAGKVTALVGDNGAGKSVLIKCVAGIYEPDAGEILWEGRPVRIRNPREAAALGIEVVYQDLALCDNLDVVENMFLGRERLASGLLDEDGMEREAAGTLARLRVATLQSSRQAVASLSGGQRQAIAVAKAVMWNSKLVILDEPTAALDVQTEYEVYRHFQELTRGRLTLLISHRFSTVRMADRILYLADGRVQEAGTHDELLALDGAYARLYRLQATQYADRP